MRSILITAFIAVIVLSINAQTQTNRSRNGLELENRDLIVGDQTQNPEIPSDIINLNNTAVAKGIKGNYAAAIIDFRQAFAAAPQCLQCGYNLATSLFRTNEFTESAKILSQIVKVRPDYAQAFSGLGDALYGEEKFAESISAYRRSLELMPDNASTTNNLGNALNESGDSEQALKYFEAAIKLDANLTAAHSNRGALLYKFGRYKEAVESMRRAVVLDANSAEAHNNLGVALGRVGKNREAHKYLLEAVRLRPDFAFAQYNLAMSHLVRGDRDAARRQMLLLEGIDADLSAEFKKRFLQPFVVDAAQIEANFLERKP